MRKKETNATEYIDFDNLSIFEHVWVYQNLQGSGLLPGGDVLPDEDEDEEIRWAPGAMEAVLTPKETVPAEVVMEKTDELIEILKTIKNDYSQSDVQKLENAFSFPHTLSVIDHVLQRLITDKNFDEPAVYNICKQLFLKSKSRGAVKFSMGVMSLFSIPEDLELFKIIARHEEFTLYAAVAVLMCTVNPIPHFIEMAEKVEGWGRIHLVHRLEDYKQPQVRNFLLKTGCRNRIGEEYTASSIARAVKLEKILGRKTLDKPSYQGAGVILKALANASIINGPFLGMETYPEVLEAIKGYMRHAPSKAATPADLLAVNKIHELIRNQRCMEKMKWAEEDLKEMEKSCAIVLENKSWADIIKKGIRSDDISLVWDSFQGAKKLDIDITKDLMAKIMKDPFNDTLWYHLSQNANNNNIDLITRLFIEISSFYDEDVIADNWYQYNNALRYMLGILQYYPGAASEIIGFALYSEDSCTINAAFKTLSFWDKSHIKDNISRLILELSKDSDEMIQIGSERLLKKWGLAPDYATIHS